MRCILFLHKFLYIMHIYMKFIEEINNNKMLYTMCFLKINNCSDCNKIIILCKIDLNITN